MVKQLGDYQKIGYIIISGNSHNNVTNNIT